MAGNEKRKGEERGDGASVPPLRPPTYLQSTREHAEHSCACRLGDSWTPTDVRSRRGHVEYPRTRGAGVSSGRHVVPMMLSRARPCCRHQLFELHCTRLLFLNSHACTLLDFGPTASVALYWCAVLVDRGPVRMPTVCGNSSTLVCYGCEVCASNQQLWPLRGSLGLVGPSRKTIEIQKKKEVQFHSDFQGARPA